MIGGINPYAYVYLSPVNGIDPSGNFSGLGCSIGGIAGFLAGGVACAYLGSGAAVCASEGAIIVGGLIGCAGGSLVPAPVEDRSCSNCAIMSKGGKKTLKMNIQGK